MILPLVIFMKIVFKTSPPPPIFVKSSQSPQITAFFLNNFMFKWCSFVYLWILMVVIEFLYIDVFRWPLMNDVISMPSGSWASKGTNKKLYIEMRHTGSHADHESFACRISVTDSLPN